MQIGRHIVVTGYEHPAEEDELLKYWQELSHTSWFQDHPLLQAPSLQDIQIIRISSLLCAGSRGYRSEILYTIEGIWRRQSLRATGLNWFVGDAGCVRCPHVSCCTCRESKLRMFCALGSDGPLIDDAFSVLVSWLVHRYCTSPR